MSTARSDGHAIYYELEPGASDDVVVLLNEAALGSWQWGWQFAALAGPFTVLAFDPRGTGRSEVPPGPYDVGTLAADLEAVLADAGVGRAHLVGCGLGGMVALRYASEYGRARSLGLLGTALSGTVVTDALDRLGGPDALGACLTPEFREGHPDVVAGIEEWRASDAGEEGRTAQAAAMREFECESPVAVTLPALVCHGDADPVVPPAAGETLAEALPRGEHHALRGRHLAHVEDSKAANDALVGFLEGRVE